MVRKARTSGMTVEAHELVGDNGGRPAVIVDDMISTGATIEAAMNVIVACGGADDIVVAATHGPLVGEAIDRISTRAAPAPARYRHRDEAGGVVSGGALGLHPARRRDRTLPSQ